MIGNFILGQLIPGVSSDSAAEAPAKIASDISELKSLSFNDLLDKLAHMSVQLVINIAIAVVVFYAGRFIIRKLYGLVETIFEKKKIEVSLRTFVLSLINLVLYFILIVTVIGILGIETTSFLALFASAGVAVGMALSGTLQNFAGGVLILLLKPYKVGDFIEVQGYAGTVKEIQIFFTVITTADNKTILIPNGGLSTGSVNNYSKEELRRVNWTVSIAYGDEVEAARRAILEMFTSDGRIQKEDAVAPKVFVDQLGASSVDLTVRAWVKNTDYWAVYFDYNEKFYNELPENGVNFPFPQLDVHLNGSLSADGKL